MRHFLILLALFGAVAVSTPYFWVVWDMSFGAARVGILHEDGVTQWSENGPRAHWPEWVPYPEGAQFTTVSYYEAAPGHPESGLARVTPNLPVAEIQEAYADTLVESGWEVTVWSQSTTNADMPPRDIRLCSVTASLDDKSLILTLFDGDERHSKITWQIGGQRPSELVGASRSAC